MTEPPPEDPPIEPRPESARLSGRVIDLDGMRVQWGLSRARVRHCEHRAMVYDEAERRVFCEDCRRTVDGFDAFMSLVRGMEGMLRELERKRAEADAALEHVVRLRATKALDEVWSGRRSHTGAVACPHCRRGLLPEDFTDRRGIRMSRELELARRAKENQG